MNRSPGEPSESRALPPTAGRSLWRRSWLRVVGILLVAYLLVLGLMMAMEDSLIYFPSVYPDGMWNPPGLDFEDAWFEAADGTKLHGWYVPVANPRAVILFAHGNAGNLSHRVDFLEMLNQLRVTVLIFDYRGYGRSTGSPSEAGVLQDARAARRWLAERADIDESKIVLLGESLGGGVMVDLAAADGARGAGVAKHVHVANRRRQVSLSLAAHQHADAHPVRFVIQDWPLPRPAVAVSWRRGHDHSVCPGPAIVRRGQRTEATHDHSRRRP